MTFESNLDTFGAKSQIAMNYFYFQSRKFLLFKSTTFLITLKKAIVLVAFSGTKYMDNP